MFPEVFACAMETPSVCEPHAIAVAVALCDAGKNCAASSDGAFIRMGPPNPFNACATSNHLYELPNHRATPPAHTKAVERINAGFKPKRCDSGVKNSVDGMNTIPATSTNRLFWADVML